MDPELAFLESQKEYDPAGDYSSATAPEAAPAESVPADEDEEEYDPSAVILPSRAEQKAPSEQSPSIPPSATNTPTPGAEGLRPQPAAAAPSKQPRTVGGFVVESEDEDEVTDTNPQAGAASLNAYGTSHSPQRTISQSPNNTLAPSNETVHSAQDQGQPDVAPFVSVASNDAASVQSPAVPAQGTPVANLTMTGGSGQLNTASARPSTVPSTPVTNLPKQRLPQDRVGMLEDRIAEDPRGDSEAWLSLIEEHRRRHKIDEARAVYERFFKLFPTSAEQWLEYINMETSLDEFSRVEQIFGRCLMLNANVGLWKAYLNHVRRLHNTDIDPDKARPIITQAYEYVLEQIGIDVNSGRIWLDYIEFLKSSLPGVLGGSDWRDMQKMDTLRKVYQRAIAVPTNATLEIWREYDRFELTLNRATGRKHLQEQSPFYMTARSANNVLENITKGIKRTTLPKLPPLQGFDGYEEFMTQVQLWKNWIQWEKDDPLMIKEDKLDLYNKRVIYLYKQALIALRFWPELWFEAAEWCFENGLERQGNEFLEQGMEANPESCLLAFRQAHQIELKDDFEDDENKAARKGEAVRAPFDKVLNELYDLTNKMKKREEQSIARTKEAFAAQQAADEAVRSNENKDSDDDDGDDENAKRLKEKEEALQTQIKNISAVYEVQIRALKKTISYTWIALMRTMRRIQGKGAPLPSASGFRGIFSEARKKGKLTSDVYIATALIEHHCYQDPASRKIFERGLKLFPEDEQFSLEYIKYLVKENDLTNARAVFETVVNRLTQKPESVPRTKALFSFFHDYESRFGDLAQIVKLEKRMKDLFPEDPQLARFALRFSTPTFDPTAVRPVISLKAQMKPKMLDVVPTVEEPQAHPAPAQESRASPAVNSPRVPPAVATATAPLLPISNSPKRAFEDADNELAQPRKIARGESPLKGAAGRRLDAARRNLARASDVPSVPPPPPLPREINFLLNIIPNARDYDVPYIFHPQKLVAVLQAINLPSSVAPQPAPPVPVPQAGPSMNHWGQPPQGGMGGYYGR